MKIAVLTDYYPPYHLGGYELNCQVTVDELGKRGHDCTVITSTFGVTAGAPEEGQVLRVLQLLLPSGGGGVAARLTQLRNAAAGRRNYRTARAVMEKVRPDLVFVWRAGGLSLFAINAAHDLNLPVVYELGDYWLMEMKQDFVLEENPVKRGYRNLLFGGGKFHQLDFSNIITVSEALKRSYVAHGFAPASITVIPRGVPESLLQERQDAAPLPGAPLNLLYAGRIVTEKGVHVAVLSVDHLVHSLGITGVHLDIIGSGRDDYLAALKSLIRERKLEEHVEIKGQVPRRELLESYRRYHALLVPSVWEEPFANTILEGMARGLPVIATKVGGAPEVIDHGVNGLLVAPSDSAAMAEAIASLGADGALAGKLRTAGLRTVRERYQQKQITDRIESYLLDVARIGTNGTP